MSLRANSTARMCTTITRTIRASLRHFWNAVEALGYKRTIVVFQPHTYTRTMALFHDFVRQLRRPDVLYLAEIFAAREKNILGISSADLAEKIEGAKFFKTFEEIERDLRKTAQPGDLILTVGAGNVYKIGEHRPTITRPETEKKYADKLARTFLL